MATINDKLAEVKGITEAELAQVVSQIASAQSSIVRLEARKVELEALLKEFAANYPAIVAKQVDPAELRRIR